MRHIAVLVSLVLGGCNAERLYVSNESKHSVVLSVGTKKPLTVPSGFKGGFRFTVTPPVVNITAVSPVGTVRTSCPCPRNSDVLEIRIHEDGTLECGAG
jgi:hypothetical protein